MYFRYIFKLPLLVSLVFLFSGCATTNPEEPPKEYTRIDLVIVAKDDVNPDEKKRPSPILVRIYELKNSATFDAADYFSLHNSDKTAIGADLLVRDEFILRPGEKKTIKRKGRRETAALGILAGYYNLANSTWRVTHKFPPAPEAAWYRVVIPSNKVELQINLVADGIQVIDKNQ